MKVLIVDDSVVFRMAISEALKEVSGVEIIGTASNGQHCIEFFNRHAHPDLVILDMEMPIMDGIQTIEEIRKINKKAIIIVFSSFTVKGAELTFKALRMGANDFVTKQEASSTVNMNESLKMIRSILLPKIQAFEGVLTKARAKETAPASTVGTRSTRSALLDSSQYAPTEKVDIINIQNEMIKAPSLILIASSTGGPEALSTIFRGITTKPMVPILIVQHMPPLFTAKLAQMLDKLTPAVEIHEAKDGEDILPGHCYIAPGDYHMTITRDKKIALNQNAKVSHVRPSATVLFDSVCLNYPGKTMSLVLTGMGDDGGVGVKKLKARGDYVYIQDEQSSVVWGMPGTVKTLMPETKELPIMDCAKFLNRIFEYAK